MRYALVTGASSGIGYALSRELLSRGIAVIAVARRVELMKELEKKGAMIVKCDVTLPESVDQLKTLVSEKTGGCLDILFNNAGIGCSCSIMDTKDSDVEYCFDVNVFAPIRLTRELLPLLQKARGVVGFTGSTGGLVPFPFTGVYGASKAALHHYVKVLRLELELVDVRVLEVVTGMVKTGIKNPVILPEELLFRYPKVSEIMASRPNPNDSPKSEDPAKYAKEVVDDLLGTKPEKVGITYRGGMAFQVWLMSFLPSRVVNYIVRKVARLDDIKKALSYKSDTA